MDWGKIDKHSDLFNRMSDTLHVDVTGEMLAGRVSPFEVRDRMLRCMNCGAADECEKFLATHQEGAEQAPDYCRNSDLFARLGEIARRP